MKGSALILFIIGLLLEAAAFFSSQAEDIPLVLTALAPRYVAAQVGLSKLDSDLVLTSDDPGFAELSNLLLAEAANQNAPEVVSLLSVTRITRGRPSLVFNRRTVRERIATTFHLSNEQEINWDLAVLTNRVESLKSQRLFVAATLVFIAGVLVQIIGFVIQAGRSRSGSDDIA